MLKPTQDQLNAQVFQETNLPVYCIIMSVAFLQSSNRLELIYVWYYSNYWDTLGWKQLISSATYVTTSQGTCVNLMITVTNN